MHSSARTRWAVGVAATAFVGVLAAFLIVRPGGPTAVRAVDDVAEFVAAFAGAVPCVWRATRTAGRSRASWLLVAAALVSWGAGEVVWTWYEVVARTENPFPSPADLGFLLFPVLALTGLLLRPSAAFRGGGRVRVVLDGVMVACSLLIISWATTLGQVYHAGAQTRFGLAVSLAYPASDVVMLTVALLVGIRTRAHTGLFLLLAGLVAMAVADSTFAYMTAAGHDLTGAFGDLGWVAAFLLIGMSALYPATEEQQARVATGSPLILSLPYALVLAGTAAEVAAVVGGRVDVAGVAVSCAAVLALFGRQWLTLADNRRLTRDVLAQQAELRFRAFHDGLTGLANRALFHDRITQALELHRRDRRSVSVVFCDLDDFKAVNDTFGHGVGDAVLTVVGERLQRVVRSGDLVARLGGDEFAVLSEYHVDARLGADVEILVERVRDVFAEPVAVGGYAIKVRASVGAATVEGSVTPGVEDVLRRADFVMYAAKQANKSAAAPLGGVAPVSVDADTDEALALADDVRDGRLPVAFQPIVLPDGEQMAAEALARWNRHGRPVPPDHFIPLAERNGLLPDLDLHVAARAVERAAAAGSAADAFVNFGLTTLGMADLPDRLLALLAAADVSAGRLVVEVPETRLITDPRILDVLTELRSCGFKIAIDDFGIGYSNLARLGALAPDVIKFDRSLIEPLGGSHASARIVASMIALAHDLGAMTVAEGVETPAQRDALVALGCDAMQGYLLGRPVVPEQPPALVPVA
ncbi:putative bifunctional diguanylate cyclase/phosphodiesterase [Jatrophihabitans endophyticus]|uniref:putative bifunctional diguanylate cyclase/phosphodiesterase n=1 Tax=Jatrophihabitans endophyticus TaxID=1206085 RepID=UPI0013564673|nr:bifunctional diguanylate cyclase/phosphodiesterase [Jatrophihabitans endophyticus]